MEEIKEYGPWRLPNLWELMKDYEEDVEDYEETVFWSSTLDDDKHNIAYLDFHNGKSEYTERLLTGAVRYVRDVLHEDGTTRLERKDTEYYAMNWNEANKQLDKLNSPDPDISKYYNKAQNRLITLEWGEVRRSVTWDEAMNWGESLVDGWGIPAIEELESVVDKGICNPATKVKGFTPDFFWSSSPDVSDSSRAWHVNLKYGGSCYYHKPVKYSVRSVRELVC